MKNKILISLVIVILGILAFGMINVSAATQGIYTYTVSGGEATITDCQSSASGAIKIPSTLGGYPVTSIGNSAFYNCYKLASIEIPDSVTSIGDHAFYACISLASITIPDSVTSIGDYAFYYCISLASITIPDSVTSIGSYAFNYCDSLASVTLGSGVTSIGDYAFSSCSSLASIEIPDSVTSIGSWAFSNCYSLASIEIPDSVTSIGSWAFSYCDSLASIEIPDSVTSIGSSAFYNCDSLASVTLGSGVTSIGSSAFGYCDSLASITVDENNQYYSSDERGVLFNKDKTTLIQYPTGNSATSYIIPDSVTSIGNSAFSSCSSLASIDIPDSVTSIGSWAFAYCDSLASVTLGNGVTSIEYNAFYDCDTLASIVIPDSVTSIGASAFRYCNNLASITVDENNQYFSSDERGVLFNKDKTTLIQYPMGNSATSYIIPDSVTSIGDYAFAYCSSLTSIEIPGSGVTSIGSSAFEDCDSLASVTLGSGVTSIGSSAFYSCDSLASIEIPDSVTSIGDDAFDSCASLTSITIPDSVTSIGDDAFYSCDSLASVTLGSGVTSIGSYAFASCDSLKTVYYNGTQEMWNKISIGSGNYSLTDARLIYIIASGECGTNLTWKLYDEGTLTISGTGDMTNWSSYSSVPWYSRRASIKNVVIGNGVTSIGDYAFYYCYNLTNITIPDSVTSMGGYVFSYCSSLTSVTIPDSVTRIDDYAFRDCTSLASITIPDSVTSIGFNAFYSCNNLNIVYYNGTEAMWNNIAIDASNTNLTSTERIYLPEKYSTSFNGAQIRTKGIQGLRFVFSIPKSVYDMVEHPESSSDTGLGFGSVVMPKKLLGDNKLKKETSVTVNGKVYEAGIVPAVNLFEVTDDEVKFTVCIINIPEKDYKEEYIAIPYVTFFNGDAEITVYGEQTEGVTVNSITEIAYSDETTSDSLKEYLEGILNA